MSVRFTKDVRVNGADAAYDPDQDPEEKRQVRRRYRDLNKIGDGACAPGARGPVITRAHRSDQPERVHRG
jgi:hypothetical protein